MSNKSVLIFLIFVAGVGTTLVPCLVPDLYAQSAENVAIIINDNSPASQRIGEYYARKHALPPSNVIRIRTSAEETIERLLEHLTLPGRSSAKHYAWIVAEGQCRRT